MSGQRKRKLKWAAISIGAIICTSILAAGYLGQVLTYLFGSLRGRYYPDYSIVGMLRFAFGTGTGRTVMLVFGLLLMFCAYAIMMQRHKMHRYTQDERDFDVSERGTFGTARWMRENEIRKHFAVDRIEKIDGTIFGMLPQKRVKKNAAPANLVSARKSKYTPNMNMLVLGPPGRGKTRSYIMPHILQSIRRGESLVVTDPKGELYMDTNELFRREGYTVRIFDVQNRKHMLHSDSWNPFTQFIDEEGNYDIEAVLTFVRIFITNTQGLGDQPFWGETAEQLLTAQIAFALNENKNGQMKLNVKSGDEEKRSITLEKADSLGGIYRNLMKMTPADLQSLYLSNIIKPESPTYTPARGYANNPDKLLANIYAGLAQRLRYFTEPALCRITERADIDLSLPAKEKCVYYVIMDDTQNTYAFLTACFFTFLFKALKEYADTRTDRRCTVPVNILMDELASCGTIPNFDGFLSVARSRNIKVSMCIQSISQLEDMYTRTKKWKTIINTCQYFIVMGGGQDPDQLKYLSEILGTTTIVSGAVRTSRKTVLPVQYKGEYMYQSGENQRALMTPDEIRCLPDGTLLVIPQNLPPMKLQMYDYSNHPMSVLLSPKHVFGHTPEWRIEEMAHKLHEISELEAQEEKEKERLLDMKSDILMDLEKESKKGGKTSRKAEAYESRLREIEESLDGLHDKYAEMRKNQYQSTLDLYRALQTDIREHNINIGWKERELEREEKKRRGKPATEGREKDWIENLNNGLRRERNYLHEHETQMRELWDIAVRAYGSQFRQDVEGIDRKQNGHSEAQGGSSERKARAAVRPMKPPQPRQKPDPEQKKQEAARKEHRKESPEPLSPEGPAATSQQQSEKPRTAMSPPPSVKPEFHKPGTERPPVVVVPKSKYKVMKPESPKMEDLTNVSVADE